MGGETFSVSEAAPREFPKKKLILIAAVVAALIVGVVVFMMITAPEPAPKLVLEPEPVSVPEPEPEPEPEIIIEPEIETMSESEPKPEPESVPDLVLIPEPVVVMIPDPVPVQPSEIPELPEEVQTEVAAEEILAEVARVKALPGIPVPDANAAAGLIQSVYSSDTLTINGVELTLKGFKGPKEGEADFDEARQALMRLCPVGSLALYDDSRSKADVWCYGYPSTTPLATVSEVMNEADYDIIGHGCHVPHEGRLLGCSN